MTSRAFGLLAWISLLVGGCESSPPAAQLAADQALRLVVPQDVLTLDPAKIHQPSVGLSLARNVFGGLYRFRDDLVEEPDLATGMPEISADGLTWTFHLRADAHFSNGDPVTAVDVLYSWNRVAALTAYDSAFIFEVVVGDSDVVQKKSRTLSGLTSTDDHTVVAKLTSPAGWWLVELGLWAAAVIDKKVVDHLGEDQWWSTPEGLVGTGPFRMSKRDVGRSFDFEPIPNWWRGSTGRLKRVHVDVIADEAAQTSRYVAGEDDILGYAPIDTVAQFGIETVARFTADSRLKGDLYIRPWLRTFLLGFPRSGRLATDLDLDGRRALSQVLDRRRLASVCIQGLTCAPATGGLILKGLAGYLGDGADPYAKHDVAAAQALLRNWDPDGSHRTLRVGVVLRFESLATEIKDEWQAALGLNVQMEVADGRTVFQNASRGLYDAIVGSFIADYDSPQNWYDNIMNSCWAGSRDPRVMDHLAAADKKPPTEALSDYAEVGKLLAIAAACAPVAYAQGGYLIKPWVRGAGGNSLYEYYWTSIYILKH